MPRHAHRRRRARAVVIAAMMAGLGAIGFASVADLAPLLMWNGSASAPLGLYRMASPDGIGRSDLVLVRPPGLARKLAVERGYLPVGVPLLKRVAAVVGDVVCADFGKLAINGVPVAEALKADSLGRPLEPWIGCRPLERDEFLVLMTTIPASFDSRYFGPVERSLIVGRAVPLWTW